MIKIVKRWKARGTGWGGEPMNSRQCGGGGLENNAIESRNIRKPIDIVVTGGKIKEVDRKEESEGEIEIVR